MSQAYWQPALDQLLRTAHQHQGLLPSILDRHTGQMPAEMPAPIAGQRQHDRAPRGCNLMHDVELLGAVRLLGKVTGEPRFGNVVSDYLTRFMSRCTQTPTGLFAWGEHAYWDLDRDALGNSNAHAGRTTNRGAYHDHLREAPQWLWRQLWSINPDAVERFAGALCWHWKSGRLAHEYFRHAYMEHPEIPLPHEAISRDFPRHSGFYLQDISFVLAHRRSDLLIDLAQRFGGYWWPHRHTTGLLPIQSRSDNDDPSERAYSVGQTVSLGVSMLDAAPLLRCGGLTSLADDVERHGCVFLEGCLAAPHDPAHGIFAQAVHRDHWTCLSQYVAWGTRYGESAAVGALAWFLIRAAVLTGDSRYTQLARHALAWAFSQPIPADLPICARDLAITLRAAIDLARLGDDDAEPWIDLATERAIALLGDALLPRAAVGCDWYEAQLGSSDLLAALIHVDLHHQGAPAGTVALEQEL